MFLILSILIGTLLADALIFRHRLAVGIRIAAMLSIDRIEDTLNSPSGDTTLYIVGTHWLDLDSYKVYISSGRLIPLRAYIVTDAADPVYPRDITAEWNGPLFTAGDNLVSVAFDERNGRLYTIHDWIQKPVLLDDEGTEPRAAFARYIDTLR